MSLSLVIPTLNEAKYIGTTLASLAHQTLRPDQIIVVDGGSEDKTVSIIKKYPEVTLVSARRGTAYQRNAGAEKAHTDLILFLDADVYLKPTFLQETLKRFNRSRLGIACPLFLPYQSTLGINLIFCLMNFIFITMQKLIPSGAGPCILVDRCLFEQTGGFKADVVHDDIEFIRRASRRGGRFGIILTRCFVSDRRFRQEGAVSVLITYLRLGLLFSIGRFKQANNIRYDMSASRYTKQPE